MAMLKSVGFRSGKSFTLHLTKISGFLEKPFSVEVMLDLDGKGKFLNHLHRYLGYWISFLALLCLQCVTARSENPLINKCYQAVMSHIFFSLFQWGSAPDGKCCVNAGSHKAWPDSGDTLLHKSLNKEQVPRDFLTHSVTSTVLAQDFFQTFLFFLLWLAFHIFLNISYKELLWPSSHL